MVGGQIGNHIIEAVAPVARLTDFRIEAAQHTDGARGGGAGGVLHVEFARLARGPLGQRALRVLEALLAQRAGTSQHLQRVVLREALDDPVRAWFAACTHRNVHQLVQKGAGAVLADQRPVSVDEYGGGTRQRATPHRISRANDQHPGGKLRKDALQGRHRPVEQRQDIHPPHAFANRSCNRQARAPDRVTPGTDLAEQEPAGGSMEELARIVDGEPSTGVTQVR